MDIKSEVSQFSPVSGGWKPWVGLFLVVVLAVAVARKLGVQQKINKAIKADS